MNDCLIGSTGFLGSNLLTQRQFSAQYHSTNIADIRGRSFETVVCAGIQARKWWANMHPEEDWNSIENLLTHLRHVHARRFVLLSTVDVYGDVGAGHDETYDPRNDANHSYGRHRLFAEQHIRELFPNALILRLPALFGINLKKNALYDLLHANNLEDMNALSEYQWYGLAHLSEDIARCEKDGLPLVNIAPKAIPTTEIIEQCFNDQYDWTDDGRIFPRGKEPPPVAAPIARYDVRSIYPLMEGGDVLEEMKRYVESVQGFMGAGS